MRRLIVVLFFLLFFKIDVFATDACDRLVPQHANFIWKATFASNLRDYPCVYKSNIFWASKIWETYEIISKVDGWYQVKSNNWNIYRIRDKSIVKTNDIIKKNYILTSSDKIIINKIVYKIEKSIQEKWLLYRNSLSSKIWNLLESWKYSFRLTSILEELVNRINWIKIINEEVSVEQENIVLNTTYKLENIDIWKVKSAWLSWYNSVRKDLWEKPYSYNSKLEQTALDWSKTSKTGGDITHKRNPWDYYYDYNKITSWFADRWVVCKNINRITHTENIWRWQYSCNDGECTDELTNAIKSTFNFYMSEKNESYKAHYESIIQPYFTIMWLWIELDEIKNWYFKYYLTVHFCTELLD